MTRCPDPVEIGCLICHRDMHIEMEYGTIEYDRRVVAASCDCGRFVLYLHLHAWDRMKVDRQRFESMTPDQLGAWGKEMREHAQQRMLDAERLIAAATWARS